MNDSLIVKTTVDDNNEERDLSGKEINVLSAVSMMLCASNNIKGNMQSGYIKEPRDLTQSVKDKQKQTYLENKIPHDQYEPSPTGNRSLSKQTIQCIKSGDVIVPGIDPGFVTTASVGRTTEHVCFNYTNRYIALYNLEDIATPGHVPDKEAPLS